MTRSILVGEVRTGRRITQIPVSGASWSMVHRGPGEVTVDIPLDATDFSALERTLLGGAWFGDPGWVVSPSTVTDPPVPLWLPGDGLRPEFLSAIEPLRCFLAVVEDDVVLEAGPIWAWDYDDTTGVLKVKAAGLWSLFDHRYVIGLVSSWPDGFAARWSQTWSGLSLATIAKRLIQLAMSHTGGSLPIVLPADETAADDADHTRTYRGHELATVRSRVEQLMEVQGGPDIAFEPRLTADRLGVEWVMRTGTEASPLLSQQGDDHVWDARVPQSGVMGISVSRDASSVGARSWVTGAGQDEALLMARSDDNTLVSAGFPLTEVSAARSTVEVQSTLNAWASGMLVGALRPWQTWRAVVSASQAPRLGTYRPGDFARVWMRQDHRLLGLLMREGYYRTRILKVSGGLDDTVTLELQPSMEVR